MFRTSLVAIALSVVALPLQAGPSDDVIAVEVLPGWRTASGTQMAALRFTLAPGWKTYWRAPGDAGIPPVFAFAGSDNIGTATLHWPVPEVFQLNGMTSVGYSGQVVIPVEVTPAAADGPVRLAGTVDLGICRDICMPMTLSFDALLPVGGDRDPAIAAALVDQPLTAAEAGVTAARCAMEPSDDGLGVVAALQMPPDGGGEFVVIESGYPGIWVSEAQTRWQDGWLLAEVDMIAADGGPVSLDRSAVRITVLGDSGAVDIRGCDAG